MLSLRINLIDSIFINIITTIVVLVVVFVIVAAAIGIVKVDYRSS